jgi:hypothetical protein
MLIALGGIAAEARHTGNYALDQRAGYDVELAERRYQSVDPEIDGTGADWQDRLAREVGLTSAVGQACGTAVVYHVALTDACFRR